MIEAEDDTYGIQQLEARTAGGDWEDITDTGFITISQNTRVYVRATNGLGQELKKSKSISCFDSEAPTVAIRQNGKTARIMAQDELSGVSYLLIDGAKVDVTDIAWDVNDVVVDYELPAGIKTLAVYAVDNAGNRSAKATLEVDTSLLGGGPDDGNPASKPGGNNPNGGSTGNGNPGGGNPGTGTPNGSNPNGNNPNGGNPNGSLPNTGNPGGGGTNGLPNTGNPDGNGSGGNPVDGNPESGQQNPGQPSSLREQPEDGSEAGDGSPSAEDGKVKYIVIGGEDGQPQKLYETTYYLPTIKIPVMDGMDAEEICTLVEAALKAAMPTNTSGSGGCGEHCICCQCMQQRCGLAEQEAASQAETPAASTTGEDSSPAHWQIVLIIILILLVIGMLVYWLIHHFGYEE